jgi:tetratricopeptide (TPR) repeat protein
VPKKKDKDLDVLKELLSDLIHAREWQKARVIAENLIRIAPKDLGARTALGIVFVETGQLYEAEGCFRHVLGKDPHNASILLNMSALCAYRGDFKGQLEWALRATQSEEGGPQPHLSVSDAHIRLGQLTEAEVELQRVNELYPEDIRSHRMLGHVYLALQRLRKARDEFRTALRIDFSDAGLWCDLGHTLFLLEKYPDALAAFLRALHIQPDDPLYAYNVGNAYLTLNNYEKAIPYLMKAVQRDPEFSLAHYDLGLAFLSMGKYEESATASMAALREDPEMVSQRTNLGIGATTNLGMAYMNLGKYREAEDCFRKSLKQAASTYFNLGLTLFRQERYEESLINFQRALEIEPNDPEYLDLLSNTFLELGKLDESMDAIRAAIAADENYALAHYDLGTVLVKMNGQDAAALKSFKRSLDLDGDLYWAYYAIGCIYANQGKRKSALRFLNKAFQKGFRDMAHLEKDSDWDGLRKDPDFQALTAKYAADPAVSLE